MGELAGLLRDAKRPWETFRDWIASAKGGGVRIECLDELPAALFGKAKHALKLIADRQKEGVKS